MTLVSFVERGLYWNELPAIAIHRFQTVFAPFFWKEKKNKKLWGYIFFDGFESDFFFYFQYLLFGLERLLKVATYYLFPKSSKPIPLSKLVPLLIRKSNPIERKIWWLRSRNQPKYIHKTNNWNQQMNATLKKNHCCQ